jgi:hypothetical protein
MNRWRVGEDRGSKETDGCPLTDEVVLLIQHHMADVMMKVAMLLQIPLHCSLEELNKVQLTVKLREENTKMSHCLNGFLNKRFLFLEIRLQ